MVSILFLATEIRQGLHSGFAGIDFFLRHTAQPSPRLWGRRKFWISLFPRHLSLRSPSFVSLGHNAVIQFEERRYWSKGEFVGLVELRDFID